MKKNAKLMAELCGDAFCDKADKLSVLAAAVDFLSKGTKYRSDAVEIIRGCCPTYLERDDSQHFDTIYNEQ